MISASRSSSERNHICCSDINFEYLDGQLSRAVVLAVNGKGWAEVCQAGQQFDLGAGLLHRRTRTAFTLRQGQ